MGSRILYNRLCTSNIKRHYSSQLNTFRANDYCILRDRRKGQKFFIGPLKDEGKLFISKGVVSHKDIISRPPRSIINTHNGKRTYVHFISRGALGLKLQRSAYVIMTQFIGTSI